MTQKTDTQKELRNAYANIHRTKEVNSLNKAISNFVGGSTGKLKAKKEKYVQKLLKSSPIQYTYYIKLSTGNASIEGLSYYELKQLAKDKSIPFKHNIKKVDLIELISTYKAQKNDD